MSTKGTPEIIAHRGYSAVAPENTLAAFDLAVKAGVKWIEMDVRRTMDDVFAVLHDATLQRTTSGVGYVRKQPWKDIQPLDAGTWFGREFRNERIPSLEEVFRVIPDEVSLNLELKPARLRSQEYGVFVEQLLKLVRKYGREQSALFSSFSSALLKMTRTRGPELRLGVLTHGKVSTKPTLREMHDLRAEWFIHNIRTLRPSVVAAIQEAGFKVAAFTVNTEKQAAHALNCGVDYIITNEITNIREFVGRNTRD